MVVDFGATWCGPCRQFEPEFAALAEQHKDVAFGKVTQDKDEGDAICEAAGIGTFGAAASPNTAETRLEAE